MRASNPKKLTRKQAFIGLIIMILLLIGVEIKEIFDLPVVDQVNGWLAMVESGIVGIILGIGVLFYDIFKPGSLFASNAKNQHRSQYIVAISVPFGVIGSTLLRRSPPLIEIAGASFLSGFLLMIAIAASVRFKNKANTENEVMLSEM